MFPPEVVAFFKPILEILSPVIGPLWDVLKDWWWVPLPFILWKPFKFMWLWWRVEKWLKKEIRPCLLEIKIPKANLKPIRAMESVMSAVHAAILQPPDLWEKWVDGQVQTSIAFEVVSVGGEIHFYIRFNSPFRDAVEASIYAQYPEAEINQVDEYTKYVAHDIPNKDWDLFGCDYKMVNPHIKNDDHFPIKTYTEFETEREVLEEKRIDPVSTLLESLSKVKPNEQFWFQFVCEPISDATADPGFMGFGKTKPQLDQWRKAGEKIRDKLAYRKEKTTSQQNPMMVEAAKILLTGQATEIKKDEPEPIIPVEMRVTPGEKDVLVAMEKKMSKPIFKTNIRFIYLGRRDVWFKPNFRLAFSYFNEYSTTNLAALYPEGKTLTKIKKSFWFLPNRTRARRLYMRQRRLFRNYLNRFPAFFPRQPDGRFMLNTEEIASLFHFPSWIVSPVPGVGRVEAKKGAPPNLPTEED
ncbi:hypothetical protein ACFLYY_01225 [Patescibacteria group bacterium]